MAKWLIHGDVHAKISTLSYTKTFFEWIVKIAAAKKVNGIINLGDTFDTHGVIRAEVLGEYRNHIDIVCQKMNIDYFHILGNHEMFTPRDNTYHVLQSTKNLYSNYYAIDSRTDIGNMSFVPYLVDASTFPTDLKEICFAHQTFLGVDFGKFRPEEGVDPEAVSSEVIYCGHIHTRQNVSKVRYPGSPIPYGVNDVDQTKGIVIFDDETYQEEFIPSPFPMWRSTTIQIQDVNAIEILSNTLTAEDHWVVDLVGPKIEIANFVDSKVMIALQKQYKMRIRAQFTDVNKERVVIKALSISEMMDEYIDKVYSGSIDKDIMKVELSKLLGG